MNFKKIASCMAASAVVVSACAISASAESFNAKLGFADMSWSHQDWESCVEVTGDGTYTIDSTLVAGAEDFGVFVIDLEGMYAANPEAVATLDKIVVDGNELSFDADKIMYGDIEEKGNFRIDIYNQYSDTKDNPGVNQATTVSDSMSITFTVTGLGGAAAAEEEADAPAAEETPAVEETTAAPAADSTTSAAQTGNTAVAALAAVMALAGAAVVASKKN